MVRGGRYESGRKGLLRMVRLLTRLGFGFTTRNSKIPRIPKDFPWKVFVVLIVVQLGNGALPHLYLLFVTHRCASNRFGGFQCAGYKMGPGGFEPPASSTSTMRHLRLSPFSYESSH